MDKDLFRKTEGKVYRYYKYKRKIESIKNSIEWIEVKLKEIENDIRTTNVTIDYYQNGMGLTERVQTSSKGTSYAEEEILRAIERLEKEHCSKTKQLLKAKAKVREIEEFISHMEYNIGMLNEEYKRFIELKYGDGASILTIARKLNLAQATAYRLREELVENIADYMGICK